MKTKLLNSLLIVLAWVFYGCNTIAHAQSPNPPDCVIPFQVNVTGSGTISFGGIGGVGFDNRTIGCQTYTIFYSLSGSGTFTNIDFQSATGALHPGTFNTWATGGGSVLTGINPNTNGTTGTATFSTACANATTCNPANSWLRVLFTPGTFTGTVSGILYGYKTGYARGGGGGGGGSTPVSCALLAATSCIISPVTPGAPVIAYDASGNWIVPDFLTGVGTTSVTCGFSTPFTGTCSSSLAGSGFQNFFIQNGVGAVSRAISQSVTAKLTDIVSVFDFGAVGDGSTDDTTAINAALTASLNVYMPDPGTCFKITSPLQVHNGGSLIGASKDHGGICNYGNTDAVQSFSTTGRYITIGNLYITDGISGSRTAGHGIHIRSDNSTSSLSTIYNVYINNHEDGIRLENSLNSSISDSRIDNPLNIGVEIRGTLGSTSTNLRNVYVDTPAVNCYSTTQLSYSAWNSLACDSAVGDGYNIKNGDGGKNTGLTFNSIGAEAGSGNGIYVDGLNMVFNAPTIQLSGSGTGKAGMVIAGPSNVAINSPYLRNGDYGISVTANGQLPNTVILCNPYFISNAIATITGNTAGVVESCNAQGISNVTLAGSGGVTANLIAARDASNPTQYILPSSGQCGVGIAASSAASGNAFQLYTTPGQMLMVADNAVTAGHILIGGTTTPGRAKDSGQTLLSGVSDQTCVLGSANANALAGATFLATYFGAGIFGSNLGTITSHTCIIDNNTDSATALIAAQFSGACQFPQASTITEVDVWGGTGVVGSESTTGTSSIALQRYRPNGGGTATIFSGGALATASGYACALTTTSGTCANGTTSSSSISISTTAMNAGDWVRVSAVTPDTAQTFYRISINYTTP